MAGKSAAPLILGVGAAALLLMPKKKKSTKKGSGKKETDPNIVKSGTSSGWGWRVRRVPGEEGFADSYFGEVNAPESKEWTKAHPDGRSDPEQARLLALAAIAKAEADKAEAQQNIVMSGTMSGWGWRVKAGTPVKGFAQVYYGQAMAPDSNTWVEAHGDGRTDPEEAKLLTWEYIARAEEEKEKAQAGG